MENQTRKKFLYFTLFIIVVFLTYSLYSNKNDNLSKKITEKKEEDTINSNIIKDIKYSSRDAKGNEYIILAEEGEIDFQNSDIIFLKNVKAIIKLIKNNEIINIRSKYGKYNTINYDTIFSKNVEIEYTDNIIRGNYLDFSMEKNLLIVSKNVVYSNPENILYADVIKMNTISKDIKILMHDSKDKVLVQNIN